MQKECVYVIMLKIALVLFKIYFLVRKKGISGLMSWLAQKYELKIDLKDWLRWVKRMFLRIF